LSSTIDYDFQYTDRSPYGHAVRLIRETVRPDGLVLDIGCRLGSIADPVTEAGFVYVGVDADPAAIEALKGRGHEGHVLDPESPDLATRLVEISGGRSVAAVTLLDVIEHVPNSDALLDAIRLASQQLAHPSLILSVPNIAHFDIAAKLLLGRWDVSELGLLERTHVQFFTEQRLLELLSRRGWVQVAAKDFVLARSDQHFPADLPTLAAGTSLHELTLAVRLAADDTAHVNQFVRSFVLREQLPPEPPVVERGEWDVSVVVRTQGRRRASLIELLTCLAAQTHERFEVLLFVHTSELDAVDATRRLVDQFDFAFSRRVRVQQIIGGNRGRPLNAGLAAARGRYIAFVDDDDLVTADWVEAFTRGSQAAPGKIVRSITVEREVRRPESGEIGGATVIEGAIRFTFSPTFDFVEHCFANSTPICAFAVPAALVVALRFSFDEHVAVQEDWHFLMRCASYAGVYDTGAITAIYHRWADLDGSRATIDEDVWRAARDLVLHEFDVRPILLPPGAVRSIVAFRTELEHFRLGDNFEDGIELRRTLEETQSALAHERSMAEQFLADAKGAQARYLELTESRSWQITRPIRALQAFRARRAR
jgi:glycosyltransferase involved in cell wall biosynthesis/2-polyprenyl-3-methyl-5-hydroxy-6-metoxy-1,4-benzoquinol methylase